MTELVDKYYSIIDNYRKGLYGTTHMTIAEIIKKAGEPNLFNNMSLNEIEYLMNHSTGFVKQFFVELYSRKKNHQPINNQINTKNNNQKIKKITLNNTKKQTK